MAIPWSHWSPTPPTITQTTNPLTDESAAQLRAIVTAYVERASNNENRYAEPIELETITTYATHPDLLTMILDALTTRLGQGYPYTLKSLDILLHLLHAQRLPHPALYPPCRALYGPFIALASPSISTSGKGAAPGDAYVQAKADEFLVDVGYDVRLSDAWVGGRGDRGSAVWCKSPWMGGSGIEQSGEESEGRGSFGWRETVDSAWISRSPGTPSRTPWISSTTTTTTSFPYASAEGLTSPAGRYDGSPQRTSHLPSRYFAKTSSKGNASSGDAGVVTTNRAGRDMVVLRFLLIPQSRKAEEKGCASGFYGIIGLIIDNQWYWVVNRLYSAST